MRKYDSPFSIVDVTGKVTGRWKGQMQQRDIHWTSRLNNVLRWLRVMIQQAFARNHMGSQFLKCLDRAGPMNSRDWVSSTLSPSSRVETMPLILEIQ